MIELPLEGFLLTPVQKICKYRLQLAELLKYTKHDHPDYRPLESAIYAMRSIAVLINERKRKIESLIKLAAWQENVQDWEGEPLVKKSSELIHSGDLIKINSSGWSQERRFFLFDHQLVYCKKVHHYSLKRLRNNYIEYGYWLYHIQSMLYNMYSIVYMFLCKPAGFVMARCDGLQGKNRS